MSKFDKHKEYKLKLPKKYYEKKGLSGIQNLGNTCYVNSIIQSLSNTLKLTDYLLTNEYKKDDPREMNKKNANYNITLSYIFVLKKIWESNTVIKPLSFVNKLRNIKQVTNEQQDAHEFLLFMLNNLNENLAYPININFSDKLTNIQKDIVSKFYNMNKDDYSIIKENFNIMFLISIKCNKCENEDLMYEQSYDISLSINKSCLLNELLDEYFKEEYIDDKKCDKCNYKGCIKKIYLWNLPKYIIIHLQKFDNNGKKINKHIDYLNSKINYLKYFSPNREAKHNYFYDLYSVICHQGNSNNGHYYNISKNLNNKIYKYDDTDVCEQETFNTNDAYILFLERKFIIKK